MPRFYVSKLAGGFTLLESVVVVAIVGILAALGIPSTIAAYQRAQLNQAVDRTISTLRETQAAAVRHNQNCIVTFDRYRPKIDISANCSSQLESLSFPDLIELRDTGIKNRIQYGIRGNITTNKTIILGLKNKPDTEKCISVSAPLGIMRMGVYDSVNQVCKKSV